ncbi:MAG: sensor histidine kinase [Chitinophagaceae bacterium]|nr:MAG: sensor histidine kinase [Chitinophagaceae bacterium]
MNDAIYIIIFIGAFLAVIITFFIITMLRYHRRYVRLQKDRVMNEIAVLENERKRMAYDLHDGLGPMLSSIKLNINSIDTTSKEDEAIIRKASHHIDETITNMRAISYNLLPVTLERKGLFEALREFIDHSSARSNLPIQLFLKHPVKIAKDKEIHVFRMLQEIIHNSIKHAKAKNLYIGFGYDEEKVVIFAKDDGIGFDYHHVKERSAGLGLKSIESRADLLNCLMLVESSPGKGTSWLFKFR